MPDNQPLPGHLLNCCISLAHAPEQLRRCTPLATRADITPDNIGHCLGY